MITMVGSESNISTAIDDFEMKALLSSVVREVHHPGHDPALSDVAAKSSLHRRHAREAPGRPGRPEEGRRNRGQERFRTAAVAETRRMASAPSCARISDHACLGASVTRPGFLNNPRVVDRLGGVQPAWTALTYKSFNALQQEPSATNMALRLANDLTVSELNASAVARSSLQLLREAARGGGLKLTATGNLTRAVVAEMIDLFYWPYFDKTELFRLNKVINEPDFLPLLDWFAQFDVETERASSTLN
jgi:hypothetical protein